MKPNPEHIELSRKLKEVENVYTNTRKKWEKDVLDLNAQITELQTKLRTIPDQIGD